MSKLPKGMMVAVMHGWDGDEEYSFKAEVVEYEGETVRVIDEEDIIHTLNPSEIVVLH